MRIYLLSEFLLRLNIFRGMPGLEKSYNTIRFGMELVKMLGICQMNVKISKIILAIILEENRRRRYDDGFI